jgi:hypothetical protein
MEQLVDMGMRWVLANAPWWVHVTVLMILGCAMLATLLPLPAAGGSRVYAVAHRAVNVFAFNVLQARNALAPMLQRAGISFEVLGRQAYETWRIAHEQPGKRLASWDGLSPAARQAWISAATAVALPSTKRPSVPPLVVLLLLALVAGCTAAWPQTCREDAAGIHCACKRQGVTIVPHPDGRPRPAGRIVFACDGTPLPLTVDADEVVTP